MAPAAPALLPKPRPRPSAVVLLPLLGTSCMDEDEDEDDGPVADPLKDSAPSAPSEVFDSLSDTPPEASSGRE